MCGGRQLAADLAVDMNFTTISTKKGVACTWEEKVTLWWELLLFLFQFWVDMSDYIGMLGCHGNVLLQKPSV